MIDLVFDVYKVQTSNNLQTWLPHPPSPRSPAWRAWAPPPLTACSIGARASIKRKFSPQPGRPRRGENFRFAYVLPDEASPFFGLIDRQIAQSAGDFRHQHITEVTHRLDARNPVQFAGELAALGDTVEVIGPDRFNSMPTPGYAEIRLALAPGRGS